MKKILFLLFFSFCILIAKAGPYFSGTSQLNNLLVAVGQPTRDTSDNDHSESSAIALWGTGDGSTASPSDPSAGWIWGEKIWPVATLPIGYTTDAEPNFEFLTAIDWSNGKGNGGVKYVQVRDLALQQPTTAVLGNTSTQDGEHNELRLVNSINFSGNQFYNFSFDGGNTPWAAASLSINLSNNLKDDGTTTWRSISILDFDNPSMITLDLRNNNLSLAGFAGLTLNLQSGINLLCSQTFTKTALFPTADFSAEMYSGNTQLKFYSGGTELVKGTDYTDNGDKTFTFIEAYMNQTLSCKLTDPAVPFIDYTTNKSITYTFLLADDPEELASVAISSTPPSSGAIFSGETVDLEATVLNLVGTAADNTTLLWECIPAGAGSFSSTTASTTTFTPAATDPFQIKCTATQDLSGKVTVKSSTLSFTISSMPEFVTLNITGGGITGDINNALLGGRIDASHVRHLRITGGALSNADCRTIVATFTSLVTLDLSAYNQNIPDADGSGVGAFEGLPVKRIKFNESERTIGSYAFKNCTNLVFARLDKSIVKDGAFEGCEAMTGASFHRDRTAAAIAGSNLFPAGIKIFISNTHSGDFEAALPDYNIMNGVDKPYMIATADELDAMRWFTSLGGCNFELTANIDLDEFLTDNAYLEIRTYGWSELGNWDNNFEGVFDGQNHLISNIWMARSDADNTANSSIIARDRNGDQKGLFGSNRGGALVIKNLGVSTKPGKSIRGNNQVGGIIGLGVIGMENCYFKGDVEGGTSGSVGGLIGQTQNNNTNSNYVIRSFAKGTITGGSDCGGLVGQFNGISGCYIKECFFSGVINGTAQPGGIVGEIMLDNFLLQNCYATGAVNGSDNVAGLIGKTGNHTATVEKCYVSSTIIDITNGAAGVFGNATNSAAIVIDNFILSDQIKRGTSGSSSNGPIYSYGAINTTLSADNKAFDGIVYNGAVNNETSVTRKTADEIIKWRMDGTKYVDEFDQSGWDLQDVWYRVNGENYFLPVLRNLPLSEQPAVTPSWLQVSNMTDAEITVTVRGSGVVTTSAAGSDGNYTEATGKTVTFTVTPQGGETLESFLVNGVERVSDLGSGGGEYELPNIFGVNTVMAVFSGVDDPTGLASVDITPKSIGTYPGEPVQFTATALNNMNQPADNTTFSWTCTPSTAGTFDDATLATPMFTPAVAGNIDISCVATREGVEKEKTVTVAPVALTDLQIIAGPQFYRGIYFQSEAATITFDVMANGVAITRSSFLNALVLDEGMTVQGGQLVYTPSGTGSIPVSVSLGNVMAEQDLMIYPNGVDFLDKSTWTATASSSDIGSTRGDLTPDLAIDGDTNTRWAGSPDGINGGNKDKEEWLLINLGALYTPDMIQIEWEAAKAAVYEIWVSDKEDGTYTKVGEEDNAPVSVNHLVIRTLLQNPSGNNTPIQFVKILSKLRTENDWNCSIYEVNMVGTYHTGLNQVSTDGKVIKTEYYNLQGMRVVQPVEKGVYIVKQTYDSGRVATYKLIKDSNNSIIK